MSVILSVINSSKTVNIDLFAELCEATFLLVKYMPWIKFSPSAHTVIAHSEELIEEENQTGLLNFTESGIEENNKFLRQYHMLYLRKTSQFDNLTRLWDKSNPEIVKASSRLKCLHCRSPGHTVRGCVELKKKLDSCSTDFEQLFNMVIVKNVN